MAATFEFLIKPKYPNLLKSVSLRFKKYIDASNKTDKEKLNTLEQIIAKVPGHVYWKNKDGVYLGCNDSQARTLGLDKGSEIIGKTDFDLPWSKESACNFRENDLDVMRTNTIKIVEEVLTINDKDAIMLSQKIPYFDSEGKTCGVIGLSIDITDRKKTEKELKFAKERAEVADQLKMDFIHNMERDIRTPFSGVYGLAVMLEEQESDPEKKESLAGIVKCAKELLDYCNHILDFSQTEAGALPLLEKKFNLEEIINSIYAFENPAAKIRKLSFSVNIENDVPKMLIGDPRRLQRILLNLIGNAIKFTPSGSVKLLN